MVNKDIKTVRGITQLKVNGLVIKVVDMNWQDIYNKKERVRKIFIFDCKFENNTCKIHKYKEHDREKCCCLSCAKHFGYLRVIAPDTIKMYTELFDPTDGFWTPKGCKLEDKYKSVVCLAYNCNSNVHDTSLQIRNFLDFNEYMFCK
jgi:hypothetical protein